VLDSYSRREVLIPAFRKMLRSEAPSVRLDKPGCDGGPGEMRFGDVPGARAHNL